MANRVKGEFRLDVEGEVHTIVYDFNTMVEMEDHFDEPIEQVFNQRLAKPRLKDIRTVFWFGLKRHHPEMTEEQVGDLLTKIGVQEATAQLFAAASASFGVEETGDDTDENGPPPPDPTKASD